MLWAAGRWESPHSKVRGMYAKPGKNGPCLGPWVSLTILNVSCINWEPIQVAVASMNAWLTIFVLKFLLFCFIYFINGVWGSVSVGVQAVQRRGLDPLNSETQMAVSYQMLVPGTKLKLSIRTEHRLKSLSVLNTMFSCLSKPPPFLNGYNIRNPY